MTPIRSQANRGSIMFANNVNGTIVHVRVIREPDKPTEFWYQIL